MKPRNVDEKKERIFGTLYFNKFLDSAGIYLIENSSDYSTFGFTYFIL
jgi:hypothetical protein